MMADVLALFGPLNFVALLGIAAIGLPHGAFDAAIAIQLGYTRRLIGFAAFILLYILLATMVVLAWMAAPVPCLIAFLLISMMHFGIGDARAASGFLRYAQVVAHGGIAITGISLFHRAETDRIFSYLVGPETAAVWITIEWGAGIVALAVLFCAGHALYHRLGWQSLAELAGLAFLYWLLPPLVGFAIYFCLVHSARHISNVWQVLRTRFNRSQLLRHGAAFTVASWFFGLLAIVGARDMIGLESAILRTVFIGLAALTVPHMLLVDGVFRPRNKAIRGAVNK